MNSELETKQSRETTSKETFQQADKANEDLVSQNVIGSDEEVNPQDHPINQNDSKNEIMRNHYNQKTKKMILRKNTI